jgi:copper chaperone NosL
MLMKCTAIIFLDRMKKLSVLGRISIFLVIGCVASLWFLPMWRIDLAAPQYPEGIFMEIWINDIKGNVDVINGLNHYIGMKTIHKEDFKEFIYIPIALMVFCGLGLFVLLLNRKVGYYIWALIFFAIAGVSMYNFWKWEYDYGHNLDPTAPIKVPGMAYQPPLIGYKKMLNFEALSQPDVGGWFFIAAGIIVVGVSFYEWKQAKKQLK